MSAAELRPTWPVAGPPASRPTGVRSRPFARRPTGLYYSSLLTEAQQRCIPAPTPVDPELSYTEDPAGGVLFDGCTIVTVTATPTATRFVSPVPTLTVPAAPGDSIRGGVYVQMLSPLGGRTVRLRITTFFQDAGAHSIGEAYAVYTFSQGTACPMSARAEAPAGTAFVCYYLAIQTNYGWQAGDRFSISFSTLGPSATCPPSPQESTAYLVPVWDTGALGLAPDGSCRLTVPAVALVAQPQRTIVMM